MKLKELLVKMYEGHCERLPDESDEDYLERCGNDMFNQQFGISQLSNIPNVMKKKIVIPNKIQERLNNVAWDRMQEDMKGMVKSLKLIQKINKSSDKRKELMIDALVADVIKNLDHLKWDIYDKARNIPPDVKC
jgi:dTDP-4-amino-4,6-dideoxygalactose transaminase